MIECYGDTSADPARTGVVLHRKAGLQPLLNDVISGTAPFQAILVYDVSRWGTSLLFNSFQAEPAQPDDVSVLRRARILRGQEGERKGHHRLANFCPLLHCAGSGGENVTSIRADEPDRTNDQHQNNRQHHRIFSDILALIV